MKSIPGLKIRNMTDADMPAIMEIDNRLAIGERSWPQRASSHFRTYHGQLSTVAEMDGKVIGFVMADVRGAEYALPLSGWLDIIGVDPSCQGKGIGLALLESFVERCHERGIKARAIIPETNTPLQHFLGKVGFERGNLVEMVRGFK